MVTQFESPQVRRVVESWEEGQRRGDSLKQWILAIGVPCVLLYAIQYAGNSIDAKYTSAPKVEEPENFEPRMVINEPVSIQTPAPPSSIPPISPILVLVILVVFIVAGAALFRKKSSSEPEFVDVKPADTAQPFPSAPRLVDIQPGETSSFPSNAFAANSFRSTSPSFGQQNRWDTGARASSMVGVPPIFGLGNQPLCGLSNQAGAGGMNPHTGQPQSSYDSRNYQNSTYTPIPQAPTEGGLFSKHWSAPNSNSWEQTYKEFPEVIEIGTQMMELIEKSIINPLLQKLDESDRLWEQELGNVGLKLVTHDPSLRSGDRRDPSCVSVFDRFLPQRLACHQMAVDAWTQRQTLEVYFVHPSFSTSARSYIIHRLRDWQRRGLRYGYRCFEKDVNSGITDGHIVENLLVKMLDSHSDFSKKYLHTPSLANSVSSLFGAWGGLGSQGTVFLKPARVGSEVVEYEVQTADGVKKLKPGERNIFESFGLFFLLKGRDKSGSLQEFPLSIQQIAQSSARPW